MNRVSDVKTGVVPVSLTALEVPCLPKRLNLTDGHVHRDLLGWERKILERAGRMMVTANRQNQVELERRFLKELAECADISVGQDSEAVKICDSASQAIEIIANVLRLRNIQSIGVVEPCFDNIPSILRRHDFDLVAIDEKDGFLDAIAVAASGICECLFLVSPNNPSGEWIALERLEELAQLCANRGIIVVLDASFRSYAPVGFCYDEYAVFRQAGASFFVIEDTGKTYPTSELKVAVLTFSLDLGVGVERVYEDFLLHVSPFKLMLLSQFVASSATHSPQYLDLIAANKSYLRSIDSGVFCWHDVGAIPFGWLELSDGGARQFVEDLGSLGVYVLLGDGFYWSGRCLDRFVRIALNRDQSVVKEASRVLGEYLESRETFDGNNLGVGRG